MKRFGPSSYSSDIYSGGAPKKQKSVQFKKLNAVVTGVSDLGVDRSEDGHSFSVSLERAPLNIPAHASNVTARLTKASIPNTWETPQEDSASIVETQKSDNYNPGSTEQLTITEYNQEFQKTSTQQEFIDEVDFTATNSIDNKRAIVRGLLNEGFLWRARENPDSLETDLFDRKRWYAERGGVQLSTVFFKAMEVDGSGNCQYDSSSWSADSKFEFNTNLLTCYYDGTSDLRVRARLFGFTGRNDPEHSYGTDANDTDNFIDSTDGFTVLSSARRRSVGTDTNAAVISTDQATIANTIPSGGTVQELDQDTFERVSINIGQFTGASDLGAIRTDEILPGDTTTTKTEICIGELHDNDENPVYGFSYETDVELRTTNFSTNGPTLTSTPLSGQVQECYFPNVRYDSAAEQKIGCNMGNFFVIGRQLTSIEKNAMQDYLLEDSKTAVRKPPLTRLCPVITIGDKALNSFRSTGVSPTLYNTGFQPSILDDFTQNPIVHNGFSLRTRLNAGNQSRDGCICWGDLDNAPSVYGSSPTTGGNEGLSSQIYQNSMAAQIPRGIDTCEINLVTAECATIRDEQTDFSGVAANSFNIANPSNVLTKCMQYIKDMALYEDFQSYRVQDPVFLLSFAAGWELKKVGDAVTQSGITNALKETADEIIVMIETVLFYTPRAKILVAPPVVLYSTAPRTYFNQAMVLYDYLHENLKLLSEPDENSNVYAYGNRVQLMYNPGEFFQTASSTTDVWDDTFVEFAVDGSEGDTIQFNDNAIQLSYGYGNTTNGAVVSDGLVYRLHEFLRIHQVDNDRNRYSAIGLKWDGPRRNGLDTLGYPKDETFYYPVDKTLGQYLYSIEEVMEYMQTKGNELIKSELNYGNVVSSITYDEGANTLTIVYEISELMRAGQAQLITLDWNYVLTGKAMNKIFADTVTYTNLVHTINATTNASQANNNNVKRFTFNINLQPELSTTTSYTIDIPGSGGELYTPDRVNSFIREQIALDHGSSINNPADYFLYEKTISGYGRLGARLTALQTDGLPGQLEYDFTNCSVFKTLLGFSNLNSIKISDRTNTDSSSDYSFSLVSASNGNVSTMSDTATTLSLTTSSGSGTPIFLVTDFTQGGVNQRGDRSQMIAMIPTTATPGTTIIYDASTEVPVSCGVTLKGKNPQSLQFRLLDKDGEPIPVGANTSWAVQVLVEWEQEVQEDYLLESDTDTKFY